MKLKQAGANLQTSPWHKAGAGTRLCGQLEEIYLSPLQGQQGSGATLRAVSRSNYLSQVRLLWLWEMRKGKYYGQILKWLQAGSSSEDARACLARLQISPLGQGGFGGVGMGVAGPGAAWSCAAPPV